MFLILTVCALLCISISAVPGAAGSFDDVTGALTATPENPATADDVVVVAARLHSIYNDGDVNEASSVDACYEYAEENGLIFDELFGDAVSRDFCVADCSHPNDYGFMKMAEAIYTKICIKSV